MSEPTLLADKISVSYGGVKAVQNVSLNVSAGEVVGLIGPNGAGKTSIIDTISGFAPLEGQLYLKGSEITRSRAHQRRLKGLSRTWQSVGIFDDLTVAENVAIASATQPASAGFLQRLRSKVSSPAEVQSHLDRVGVGHLAERLPGELSHGQRVLVGVARAIAGNPHVVMMDEPGAGLDDAEGKDLAKVIRGLAADGLAILLVDHDMSLVMNVSDRIYVLDFGQLIAEGTPAEIGRDNAVIAAYLGTGNSGAPKPAGRALPKLNGAAL